MNRIWQLFSFNETEPLIFTQLDFWLFFLAVMAIFSFIHKHYLVRSFFLTAVSIFFYFKTSGLFVILLGCSLVFNYFFGNFVHQAQTDTRKKWLVGIAAVANLSILAYFKYAYFFTESFNEMFDTHFEIFNHFSFWGNSFFDGNYFAVDKIILPVGVSFFTFQSVSYFVDIYRKEIEPVKNIFDYTFFVTFFPQLVAGPIVRARDFIPQIRQPYQLDKAAFSWALIQIVKGLAKKILLADYIAVHFIDKIVETPEAFPGFVSVLAMWGYSLQIYGDFSGYTDIAIGVSALMGFRLLENFNSPYKATSVADFWRRWHKSLGSWLKDYLYIPLGGNKTGGYGTYIATILIFIFLIFITQWYGLLFIYLGVVALYSIGALLIPNFKQFVHRDLNLLITMVVGGLWHGASENFVIWGAMNGLALILYNYWKKVSPYEHNTANLVRIWKIFITFNFITFTRIWFRLEDESGPGALLAQIWYHFDFSWETFLQVLVTYQSVFWLILFGYVVHWLPQKVKALWENIFTKFPLWLQAVTIGVMVILMYQAISDTFKPFVYFQF
jgi:D-alanyl-lipoteichoic acid acyltransferase DltB (MBOAT superfamily)